MDKSKEIAIASEAFGLAWLESIDAYEHRRINSERCLQANIYHHLQNILSDDFTVYIEAIVKTSGRSKIAVDTLICHKQSIVAAIELKYTPRGIPAKNNITKDLLSLSKITNRKLTKDRVTILMRRYRNKKAENIKLSIAPGRALIFATYCKEEAGRCSEENFWLNHQPKTGYWHKQNNLPPRLRLCFARADKEGHAIPDFDSRWLDNFPVDALGQGTHTA